MEGHLTSHSKCLAHTHQKPSYMRRGFTLPHVDTNREKKTHTKKKKNAQRLRATNCRLPSHNANFLAFLTAEPEQPKQFRCQHCEQFVWRIQWGDVEGYVVETRTPSYLKSKILLLICRSGVFILMFVMGPMCMCISIHVYTVTGMPVPPR